MSLADLLEMGLPVNPLSKLYWNAQEVEAFHREMLSLRGGLDYEIDGIVVKVDHFSLRRTLGANNREPRWATAWKFPPGQNATMLQEIRISHGRFGRLTPVAVLERVELGGVTVASASLHNEDDVHRKDIRPETMVIVERAGDVIPQVTGPADPIANGKAAPFRMPSRCPSCGTRVETRQSEVGHWCPNQDCPALLPEQLKSFAGKRAMDIDGLGEHWCQELVDRGMVSNTADLFFLTRERLLKLDRMGEKLADRILRELHQRDETAEPGDAANSDAPLRLTELIELTEGRPPRISLVIRKLHRGDNAKDRAWFEELLRQTVPEQAWEILQLDNEWDQILSFAARFKMNHFPLSEDHLQIQADWRQEEPEVEYEEGGPYSLLREGIPFELMGFTWDERHAMWNQTRNGLSALALLPAVPHDEADASYEYDEFQGLRQTWLESAADVIPTGTLRRIPEGGITLERLEKAVKGTHLEAAHLAGRWIYGMTGTFFLDESFPEEFNGYSDLWDDEIIEYGTQEWQKAKEILDRVEQLTTWLEEDLPERFGQMLDLILERLEEVPENSREEK